MTGIEQEIAEALRREPGKCYCLECRARTIARALDAGLGPDGLEINNTIARERFRAAFVAGLRGKDEPTVA